MVPTLNRCLPRRMTAHGLPSDHGGQTTRSTTDIKDENRPARNVTAAAVQRLFLEGYMPRKKIAKDESTNAMVPNKSVILAGTEGVPRMSMMPNTVKFKAANMPGKHALTMGFISRSSASEDMRPKWVERVYTVLHDVKHNGV
jgi:hypothetical protein